MPYSTSVTGCTLSNGLELTGCTRNSVAGLEQIYLATYKATQGTVNYDSSTGEITDLGTGYTWYKIDLVKETSSWSEAIASNIQNGTTSYTPTLSVVVNKMETKTRNLIHLLSISTVVAIAKDNNGNYVMLGRQKGLDMTAGDLSSGVANGDRNGATLTFTGAENKPSAFLDSAAIADLVALAQY